MKLERIVLILIGILVFTAFITSAVQYFLDENTIVIEDEGEIKVFKFDEKIDIQKQEQRRDDLIKNLAEFKEIKEEWISECVINCQYSCEIQADKFESGMTKEINEINEMLK